jgi:hypothetical protein
MIRVAGKEKEPLSYLKDYITELSNYLVDKVPDRDLVGLRIQNSENLEDKVVGISLRRRDQFKLDMVWDVHGKVIQCNARFALCDRLEVNLDIVKMPNGNGGVKRKGRSLNVLSDIKRRIVVVMAAFLFMAHALIIAMARVNGDPKYNHIKIEKCMKKPFEDLLEASGVN